MSSHQPLEDKEEKTLNEENMDDKAMDIDLPAPVSGGDDFGGPVDGGFMGRFL